MKNKNENIDAVRRRVEKKFDERSGLIQHAIVYGAVNLMLWIIWLLTWTGFPWPLFVTIFWGIGMVSHYVSYHNAYGAGARKREAEIEAEVARQIELQRAREALDDDDYEDYEEAGGDVYALDNYERRGLRLSDDGELLDMPADDEDGQELARQQR